ncbi:hypothetical protein ACIBCN_18735 [Nocardia sp. NPDC051052]|uniref:hypothetical protein n=1 Tax=Nocardia sp. NPDC051052 TaxID=3364322 RepID=UPI0037961413
MRTRVVDGNLQHSMVGTPVTEAGKQRIDKRQVVASWILRDGQWRVDTKKTGYYITTKAGANLKIRTPAQLAEYIGRSVAEWVLEPIAEGTDDEQVSEVDNATEEVLEEEELSDDSTDTAAEPADGDVEAEKDSPESDAAPTLDPETRGLPAGSGHDAGQEDSPEPAAADTSTSGTVGYQESLLDDVEPAKASA